MNATSAPAVLLFTVDPSLAPLGRALQALGFEVLRATTEEEGRQMLATRRGVCLAVLDSTRGATYSADAVTKLLSQEPAVPTLMLIGADGGQAARLYHDGPACFDYAKLPAPIEELVLRVQALCVRAGLSMTAAPQPRGERPLGTMVVMFGAKGGIGRSMIAANLAVGLAQQYGHRVALVDADLWYSAQRVLLNLDSDKNIASLTRLDNPLDPDALREILVPHPSGVQVMLAPEEPWLVETIPADLPAGVARAYQREFDFVIVDTHPSTEEYVLQLLDAADRILLVTTPEVGPLRRTLEMLKLAPGLGWREKLLLVLNRADSGVWRDHIETTLDMRVDATIVSNGRLAVAAANEGVPLLQLDPLGKEQITRDVRRLVSCVAGEPDTGWEVAPPRRRWWQLWRGRHEDASSAVPPRGDVPAVRPVAPVESALALAEAEAARRLIQTGSPPAPTAPVLAPSPLPAALDDPNEDEGREPSLDGSADSSEPPAAAATAGAQPRRQKRRGRPIGAAPERRRPRAGGPGKVRPSRPAGAQGPSALALVVADVALGTSVDEDAAPSDFGQADQIVLVDEHSDEEYALDAVEEQHDGALIAEGASLAIDEEPGPEAEPDPEPHALDVKAEAAEAESLEAVLAENPDGQAANEWAYSMVDSEEFAVDGDEVPVASEPTAEGHAAADEPPTASELAAEGPEAADGLEPGDEEPLASELTAEGEDAADVLEPAGDREVPNATRGRAA
jgi:pilus assembly protein CpaE